MLLQWSEEHEQIIICQFMPAVRGPAPVDQKARSGQLCAEYKDLGKTSKGHRYTTYIDLESRVTSSRKAEGDGFKRREGKAEIFTGSVWLGGKMSDEKGNVEIRLDQEVMSHSITINSIFSFLPVFPVDISIFSYYSF